MYHDQALIPLKTLAFDRGVNVTLGLPFVRTSPDHGTAFDIAGSGRAGDRQLHRSAAAGRVHGRRGPSRQRWRRDEQGRGERAGGGRSPDGLPPLREVIAALGLSAKKSLGQNFILDLNLTRRIARAGGPLEGAHRGRGRPGTRRAHARVAAGRAPSASSRWSATSAACRRWRRSRRASRGGSSALRAMRSTSTGAPLLGGRRRARYVIVANLPYGVATRLLIGWLESEPWPPWFERMTLMFQKEVAERIVAAARRPRPMAGSR